MGAESCVSLGITDEGMKGVMNAAMNLIRECNYGTHYSHEERALMILAVVLLILAVLLVGGGLFIGSLKILLWIGLAVLVVSLVTGGIHRGRIGR